MTAEADAKEAEAEAEEEEEAEAEAEAVAEAGVTLEVAATLGQAVEARAVRHQEPSSSSPPGAVSRQQHSSNASPLRLQR